MSCLYQFFLDEEREIELVKSHIAEQGSLKLRIARSILFGEPASGKTSTRKRLTGEIKNLGKLPPLASTGIEKPCTINLYRETEKSVVLLSESMEEWKKQGLEAQCQTLLGHIMLTSPGELNQAQEQQFDQKELMSSALPVSQESVTLLTPQPTKSTSSLPPTEPRPNEKPESRKKTEKSLPMDGALERFIKNMTSTKSWEEIRQQLKGIEDTTILHITDTGGQPEFYEILPLLLQGHAIYLLFHNLSRPFEELCSISYRWEEGKRSAVYNSQFTHKDMLFQLLVSVASTSDDKLNAAVMFLGTYLDLAGQEGLRRWERELKKLI